MVDWAVVKDLAALDDYIVRNNHLNLGPVDSFRHGNRPKVGREHQFSRSVAKPIGRFGRVV